MEKLWAFLATSFRHVTCQDVFGSIKISMPELPTAFAILAFRATQNMVYMNTLVRSMVESCSVAPSSSLLNFFGRLAEDAAWQTRTGLARGAAQRNCCCAARIRQSFRLPRAPSPMFWSHEVHSEAQSQECAPPSPKQDPRDNVCRKCGRRFAMRRTLAMHERACSQS